MQVPDDARAALFDMREGVSEAAYVDHVWARRDAAHARPIAALGKWPFVRACDRVESALTEVSRLPLRART